MVLYNSKFNLFCDVRTSYISLRINETYLCCIICTRFDRTAASAAAVHGYRS